MMVSPPPFGIFFSLTLSRRGREGRPRGESASHYRPQHQRRALGAAGTKDAGRFYVRRPADLSPPAPALRGGVGRRRLTRRWAARTASPTEGRQGRVALAAEHDGGGSAPPAFEPQRTFGRRQRPPVGALAVAGTDVNRRTAGPTSPVPNGRPEGPQCRCGGMLLEHEAAGVVRTPDVLPPRRTFAVGDAPPGAGRRGLQRPTAAPDSSQSHNLGRRPKARRCPVGLLQRTPAGGSPAGGLSPPSRPSPSAPTPFLGGSDGRCTVTHSPRGTAEARPGRQSPTSTALRWFVD